MKKSKILILFILAAVFIAELLMIVIEENSRWQGTAEYISPDKKYILTVTSEHSNSFDAPYSIRLSHNGDPENRADDFYIYECKEKPAVEWGDTGVLIKCTDRDDEEVIYKIETEGTAYEE